MTRSIEIKLKEYLSKRGIMQKFVVEKTGLSKRAVSDLYNNKVERIPLTTLLKICNALDIKDIREIIDFTYDDKK